MKIPNYIKNASSYIVLSNQEIINHSQAHEEDNQFIFKGKEEVFIYLDNYQSELNIVIDASANIKLYLLSRNSKQLDYKISIDILEQGLLKLYSDFKSTRKTKVFIKRNFNIKAKGSLILLNHIAYHGEINLDDKIYLSESLANLDIDLLNVGSQDDQAYVHQNVYHQAKKTYSQIHNWLISQDQAKLDYHVNGSIEKGKEKSSCQQKNKGIILSQKGQITVVPTLLIDEYDVEASHGAAIGQIDESQLFYLLSRGLNQEEAKALIISGYINPFISKVKNKKIESLLKRTIQSKI